MCYITTYNGIIVTRSLDKPDNLKHHFIYKGLSEKIDNVYFHNEFQDDWKDILDSLDNIKEIINICVFKNYIGPKLNFYHNNFISVWNKSKDIDGISTNIKIFFNSDFKFKEQIKKYMFNLGFIFLFENKDRLIYDYDPMNVSKIFLI
jgi:hypothetical protein